MNAHSTSKEISKELENVYQSKVFRQYQRKHHTKYLIKPHVNIWFDKLDAFKNRCKVTKGFMMLYFNGLQSFSAISRLRRSKLAARSEKIRSLVVTHTNLGLRKSNTFEYIGQVGGAYPETWWRTYSGAADIGRNIQNLIGNDHWSKWKEKTTRNITT